MAIVYGLKVNLSVAMVIMVNSTALKIESLEGQQASCLSSLAEFQQLQSNETTIQKQIGITTQRCAEIETELHNVTMEARNFTKEKQNEVNMLECANVPFNRNGIQNRLGKMSKPFR